MAALHAGCRIYITSGIVVTVYRSLQAQLQGIITWLYRGTLRHTNMAEDDLMVSSRRPLLLLEAVPPVRRAFGQLYVRSVALDVPVQVSGPNFLNDPARILSTFDPKVAKHPVCYDRSPIRTHA